MKPALADTLPDALPLLSRLRFPGMLCAATIRSAVPRARSFSLSPPPLPSGYRCISAADLSAASMSALTPDGIPVFASPAVAYKGEALGLIVGPSALRCDELAAAVSVEYQEGEPEFEWEDFSPQQVVAHHKAEYGDIERAFFVSAHHERSVSRNGIFDHHYSEAMGALAKPEQNDMAVYCATQWPAHLRRSLNFVLGKTKGRILIRPTDLGTTFDGRLWFPSIVACQAAAAAQICGKPVKILYTRKEDYLYTPKQARSAASVASASDGEGRLKGLDIRLVINVGAYHPLARELVRQAAAAIASMYRCPAMHIEIYAVRSDILPLGALGSIGAAYAFFAVETHLNRLAKALDRPPAEIKAINMLAKGDSNFGAVPLSADIPFAKIHDKLELISDYKRKYASYELVKKRDPDSEGGFVRGIALTIGFQTSRFFTDRSDKEACYIEARLDAGLNLAISAETAVASQGLRSMWRKTASSILSIPENNIRFAFLDNGGSCSCGPLALSRGAAAVNRLLERLCRSIQKKRARGNFPIAASARAGASRATGDDEEFLRENPLNEGASWCGTAVEVEIDRLSGEARPLAVWMVVDAGRIVDKDSAAASLRCSVIGALNLCVGSDFRPDEDGEAQYRNNRRLAVPDIPFIGVEFLDADRPGPTRGLGELPFITVPAAFSSALSQALDADPGQLPLGGGDILKIVETS